MCDGANVDGRESCANARCSCATNALNVMTKWFALDVGAGNQIGLVVVSNARRSRRKVILMVTMDDFVSNALECMSMM